MSVSQEMTKNCAHQMHNAPTEGKLWNLLFKAEIRIGEGTVAYMELSRIML